MDNKCDGALCSKTGHKPDSVAGDFSSASRDQPIACLVPSSSLRKVTEGFLFLLHMIAIVQDRNSTDTSSKGSLAVML
jgi:hypothetical protein